MQGIHYRVERNPLTKPDSYRLRFIPQGTVGCHEPVTLTIAPT